MASCATRPKAPPKGGVISPCLSNIFLHHVLDEWFELEVQPRLKGRCTLVRYADDAVMAFEDSLDAKRVLGVLGKRLARYGLTLHPDKTRFVDFRDNRPNGTNHSETDSTSFTFLGFSVLQRHKERRATRDRKRCRKAA
jgi:RNA-directed DNA polymerase